MTALSFDAANTAAQLAAAIKARQDKVAAIQSAIQNGWQITSITMQDVHGGPQTQVNLNVLDTATSAQCLNFALSIYQGQIATLQAQYDAI